MSPLEWEEHGAMQKRIAKLEASNTDLSQIAAFQLARAEKAEKELNAALLYATDLATTLVNYMYPENTTWLPLKDICGVLSQIDNAFTAWFNDRVRAEKAEAEAARLGSLVDTCGEVIERTKLQCGNYREQVGDLQKEVERLREALKFYAAKTHMNMETIPAGTTLYAAWENGEVARKALEGE